MTPERPPLSHSVRWTLLGSAAVSLSNWLLVVVLARSSGSVAVGRYAFALALTAPVMSFAGLQMRTLLASDVKRRHPFPAYLAVTRGTTAAGVLICLALGLTGDGGADAWTVLGAVCAMRVGEAFSEVHCGFWQRREEMRIVGLGLVLQGVVSIGASLTAALLGLGALGVAVAGALGALASWAYLRWRSVTDPGEARQEAAGSPARVPRPEVEALAMEGLPMGVILLLSVLQANVPRYFIEQAAGKSELGLFAAASQLTTSGNIAVAALGAAALPRLAAWYADGSPAFFSLTRRLALVGAGLGLAGVALSAVAGRWILATIYGAEFAAAEQTLLVLSVAGGLWFVAAFLGTALTAARVIKVQPVILLGALATLVAGSAFLVPGLSSVGAAWAQAAGSGVHALACAVILVRLRRRL